MGMFDSLIVKCPECKSPVEFQSKAGECMLAEYSVNNVPDEIALDLKDEVSQCENCGYSCRLNVQVIKMITVI